jgi:hypothetical protein
VTVPYYFNNLIVFLTNEHRRLVEYPILILRNNNKLCLVFKWSSCTYAFIDSRLKTKIEMKWICLNTERRGGQDMALVHKFLTEQTGTDLFRLTAAQNRARTRQAAGEHGLSVQFARTDPRKYSFAVRTVEDWNRLPEEVKTSRNGEEFKKKMKKL